MILTMANITYIEKGNELSFTKNDATYVLKHKYLKVGHIKTHYVETGVGETILVLPGYPGPWSVYVEMICELSKNFHIISLNIPGFPGSTEPLPKGSGIIEQVEFIHNFQQAIGFNIDYILGISYGGVISLHYVQKFPGTIKKVILQSPAYNVKIITKKLKTLIDILQFALDHPRFENVILPIFQFLFWTIGLEIIIRSNGLGDVDKNIKKLILKDFEQVDLHALAEIAIDTVKPQQTALFKEIKKPIMVITGELDPQINPNASRYLADEILPNAKFVSIKNGNHWLPVLKTDLFCEKVREFILE